MKPICLFLTVLFFMVSCSNVDTDEHTNHHDSITSATAMKDTSAKSIPSEVKKQIGSTEVTINYHSPAVRGRVIWGGLVPYDEIWVTGAHKATSMEVGGAFQIGNTVLQAGKYAIFTIPGKQEWSVVINKNWDQHLADSYSEKDDVVRIKVKPQITDVVAERLKYEIDQKGERMADIIISWEKIRVPFQIQIKQ